MLRFITILIIAVSASPGFCGEKSEAKRLAEAIAPFVNERTMVVGHIDLARTPWARIRGYLLKRLPNLKRDMAKLDDAFALATELAKAGVRDVFTVLDFDTMFSEPFAVIPITKAIKTKELEAVIEILGAKRIRGAYIFGNSDIFNRLKKFKPKLRPELEQAFASAGGGTNRTASIPPSILRNALVEMIPKLPPELGGGLARELSDGIQWSVTQFQFAPELSLRLLVQSRDESSAQALQKRIPTILKMIERTDYMSEIFPEFRKLIELVSVSRNKNQLTLALKEEFFTELARQVQARYIATKPRIEATNALKHLGLAMHNFADAYGNNLPLAANYDAKGKPLLSWRVHILPWLDEEDLYKQFRLNEPWNSPHNKKLIGKMPKMYESPFGKLPDGKTIYVVPVGKGAIFDGRRKQSIGNIADGSSNTLMILTVNDANAVIWTKPDDFDVTAKDPFNRLLRPKAEGFNAALADGSVRFISRKIMLRTLQALFTRAGGEVINDKEY